MKILLTNASLVGNKGAAAMIESAIKILKRAFPQENIEISILHFKTDKVESIQNKLGISEIIYDTGNMIDISRILLWYLLKCLKIDKPALLRTRFIRSFQEADLILDLSGISFFRQEAIDVYESAKWSIVPLLIGKKYVKFIQSIGPFISLFNRIIAKLLLRNVQVILPRGHISEKALMKLKIPSSQIFPFPDSSYILDPVKNPELNNIFLKNKADKRVIGISASIVCQRLSKNYINEMSRFLNNILESFDEFNLMFIPHTDSAHLNSGDHKVIIEIMKKIEHQERISLMETEKYSAGQIKYIIGMCDFFIGSRFHSLMASVSMQVPTLCLGWHYKYLELMNWLDLLDFSIDVRKDFSAESAFSTFQKLYKSETDIRNTLSIKVPEMKKKVWQSAAVIRNYFLRKKK